MKKNVFLTGMLAFTLAIVLAFSMAVIGCDDGSDNGGTGGGGASTLTITDIPAEYNGKYAYFIHEDNPELLGAQSWDMATGILTLAQISNGRVNLPMWIVSGNSVLKYTGNDVVTPTGGTDCFVMIGNVSSFSMGTFLKIGPTASELAQSVETIYFTNRATITFSNGSATISANDGW